MHDIRSVGGLPADLARTLEPLDEHNRQLIANVHPPGRAAPVPADRYHLVVVGGGTGGLVSAAAAAGLGARVALVERSLMGGDCLNYGCVPSKAVLSAARAWHCASRASTAFGAPRIAGGGDFAAAMQRMRRLRAEISSHDSVERFSALGIDVFQGAGRFVDPTTLVVNDVRLRFRRAIVATGGRPSAPPLKGLVESGYLTNETIFTLEERPARLAVIGAGPIGCELAQAFARFGSRVTLFDIAPQILIREDADAAAVVQKSLLADGIHLELDAGIEQVGRTDDATIIDYTIAGESHQRTFDQLLVAAGRSPNIEELGLAAAGIETSKRGIEVNDRLQTSNRRVFAVGDVASKYQFTHVADALARIAVQNALFFGRKKASALVVPWCTYTQPEIGHVGLYRKQAEEAGHQVETLTVPLAEVDRSILEGSTEGFLRLHVERGKDRILGATMVADHAGDLLGELCLAVTHRVGLGKIASTIHPYPTQGEVVKKAGDAWMRRRLTPRIARLLGVFFRLFR